MLDINKIKESYPFIDQLDQEDFFEFLNQINFLSLEAGEIFIKPNEKHQNIYFVLEGLIRSYYTNKKGEEITNLIKYEGKSFSSYEGVLLNKPAGFTFQALEKTQLIFIDFIKLDSLIEKSDSFTEARKFMISGTMSEIIDSLNDFRILSPEKRYIKLIETNPILLKRVPLKFIANMLGITPVSLSRIRRRIFKK